MARIALLGSGLIADFYAQAVHGRRGRDRIGVVYSRRAEQARRFAERWDVARHTADLHEAVGAAEIDAVVIALPNHLHEAAVAAAAAAGKAVLCTKPLGRTADEALRMLQIVEHSGVFQGYLEDLCYTPKTLQALRSVAAGAVGQVLWVRSREAHGGPHSAWFWNPAESGGGAIVDLGCHCIEIARSFIGKGVRPVEVMCWADAQVHPIDVEDHAVGLVRYANGAVGQFEVSWSFRGGMDLRAEIAGSAGTILLNHWLRTGAEMYVAEGHAGYVAEKAESSSGWLFPVGDEPAALGYVDMFADMFEALERGASPRETFYDGYVVNAVIDAAYASVRSRAWAPVELPVWRGESSVQRRPHGVNYDADHLVIKRELLPDGQRRLILKHKHTGQITQIVTPT
ncbi:MAG TPA: Gfo/Idh/MocA family oxidoreductase [Lacipirellulaceae bacterium]|nr:Gfo/Idh/MocA family oxidoreductase [Lacipirellulaceae bacterium]